MKIIVLFRQDLRLKDNPALYHACQTGKPITPLYILDDETPGKWKMGGASRAWVHESLKSLKKSLQAKGSDLFIRIGKTDDVLKELLNPGDKLFWNRGFEPYARELEKKFPESETFNGSLLFDPQEILNQERKPFKVFTPFWKRCLEIADIEKPLPEPEKIHTHKIASDSWDFHPAWSHKILKHWEIGEEAASKKVITDNYEHDRDIPGIQGTSTLSPHLHFGEISPREIFYKIKNQKFLSEIGWREFCYYQLYHFPKLPDTPWRSEFTKFPWEMNENLLKKWQQGETGYPIVDAGMRQLWETGWMHNRVRMIVASFLVKDLLIPWQTGARWFWDTLVDADLANNSANWQWVAGCGFDAAPFFRIFNPTLQGKKFDPDGIYVKRWVKELQDVPAKLIHTPWLDSELTRYPKPIIDHDTCRKRALALFRQI